MRRSKKKRTGIGIIAIVVLIICGIVSYRRIGLEDQSNQYKQDIEKLDTQIKEQEERATNITNLETYVQTKRYIEDIAREKLGLVYDYEIIFKPEE